MEKDDFAAGTSGRSSRLVHGGLRYLEHGEFGLVRESLRERGILFRLAPHLVRPVPMYMLADDLRSRATYRVGLTGYELLAACGQHRLPPVGERRAGPCRCRGSTIVRLRASQASSSFSNHENGRNKSAEPAAVPAAAAGPSRIGGEEVARNQRLRIHGGMIEAVHRHGYERTTVAEVIALAGVSRRAFYEQFANREDCLLATHDILVARLRKQAIDAWLRERGWANRIRGACAVLLGAPERTPKAMRLVLVETAAAGARARERMQLAELAFERLVVSALAAAPEGPAATPLGARAIVGGLRQVTLARMLEQRDGELVALTAEALEWIECCRIPGARRATAATPLGPRTAVAPPAFLTGEARRAKALRSLVRLTLAEGYANVADARIAEHAGLSTDAFHKQFAGKRAALLALIDGFGREAVAAATARPDGACSWPQAVREGMASYLGFVLAHRGVARVALVEGPLAGPEGQARATASMTALAAALCRDGPSPRHAPAVATDAVTGALWAVVSGCLLGGRAARLAALADELAFLVLAPRIGPAAAASAIRADAPTGGA